MKKLILMVLVIAMATACKKDNDAEKILESEGITTGKYLKKVKYWTVASNEEVTIREIILDAAGNITGFKTYTSNGDILVDYNKIEKNSDGKVVKVSGKLIYSNKNSEYQFVYGTTGNITETIFYDDGVLTNSQHFQYDASNRLTSTRKYDPVAKTYSQETKYTYTGADLNPTTSIYNGISTTLKFDTKKNPSQAAPAFMYYMNMVDFYKNNLIEQTKNGVTTTSTITYNSDDFAVSTTNGSGSGLKFFYAN